VFAQPINYNGRRVAIPEESKITQDSQIAPLQIALHPAALPLGREFGHNDQQGADGSTKRHKFDMHMRRPIQTW
jgi:hypothetical protein